MVKLTCGPVVIQVRYSVDSHKYGKAQIGTGYDRLAKVRPVIETLRSSFLSSYNPHRENSIDEAMLKFKGRSTLKQYMPKKPIKRGFKVWVRADSHNGYISDVDVYTGRDDSTETNLTTDQRKLPSLFR